MDLKYIITPKGVFKCSEYNSVKPSSNKRRLDACVDDQTAKKQRIDNKRTIGLKKAPTHVTCRPMSLEEKQKFRLELLHLSQRMMMGSSMGTLFRKYGWTNLTNKTVGSYIDSTDDQTLRRMRSEIRALVNETYGKLKPTMAVQKGAESCSRSACAPAKQTQSVESTKKAKSSSRVNNSSAHLSTSYKSTRKSSENDRLGHSKLDCKVKKHPSAFHKSSSFSRLDSDGPGVVLTEEKSPHRSTSGATIIAFVEDKCSIAAKIKAAKSALQMRNQNNVKAKRERERDAARMALQKMEKSVEIYESMDVVRAVEMMFNCSRSDKPLEGLGLYLKDDYLEEDVDAISDAEEGEILP